MTTLAARIDHFARWFFNSSPEKSLIEPRPKPPATPPKVRTAPHIASTERRAMRWNGPLRARTPSPVERAAT